MLTLRYETATKVFHVSSGNIWSRLSLTFEFKISVKGLRADSHLAKKSFLAEKNIHL